MAYPSAPPPNAPPGRSRLPWLLVGALVVAIVVLVALLLREEPTPDPPDVPPTPTEEGLPASPEPPSTSAEPTSAMPLLGPTESRFVDGASAIPASADSLEDGDFFGYLHGIDPVAGTVELDVAIMYVGQAAIDWLATNDPGAGNEPPNGYIIVNEVERLRTLPVVADAPVWVWCYPDDSDELPFVQLTLAQLAAASFAGDPSCSAGSVGRDPAGLYWFDVRDGAVAQVVGQFVP